MPQTHAQEHALSRNHAGRNPRIQGAPNKSDEERPSVSRASVLNDTASAAGEAGAVNSSARADRHAIANDSRGQAARDASGGAEMEAGKGTSHGGEHERHDPATESDLQHPEQVHHNDNETSDLPDRGDEARKQAPNDRPGKKSGEGETPVG